MVIIPWSDLVYWFHVSGVRIIKAVDECPTCFEDSISKLLVDSLDFDVFLPEDIAIPMQTFRADWQVAHLVQILFEYRW